MSILITLYVYVNIYNHYAVLQAKFEGYKMAATVE
jgi:hypothetical protein